MMRVKAFCLSLLFLSISLCTAAEYPETSGITIAKGWTGKVLARGAKVHSANGIEFDSADRLYIASLFGINITVMDPDTGKVLHRFGPDRGVEAPDDVAIGPDGSVYYTSLFTGEVGRISPDGTKSTAAVLGAPVNPIAFSSSGQLFVGASFGDRLYEVDVQGTRKPKLIAKGLGGINGMDFGPDGFLYSPLPDRGEVIRINVDSGASDIVATGLTSPTAVNFDSHGRLYLTEYQTGQVLRIDAQTGAKEIVATIRPGLDNLAFDSRDRLFVSGGFAGGYIVEVQSDGSTRRVSRNGMIAPGGVAVQNRNGRETVFVADSIGGLRAFDGITGRRGDVDGVLFVSGPGPRTVSPDGDNLLLSSGANVEVWDPEKREVTQTYEPLFDEPSNAIRFQGDVVIGEVNTGSVVLLPSAQDPSERIILTDKLERPAGLVATDNDLWVSDSTTGTVWQIVADGKRLKKPIQVATGLSTPEGLALRKKDLLVVESGAGRLSAIHLATGKVRTIVTGLKLGPEGAPAQPAPHFFSGVAVGESGAVYVTGDQTNVLYRFEQKKQGAGTSTIFEED